MSFVRDWCPVSSEVPLSGDVRVPSGLRALVKALTSIGILDSIKILARITATFRIPRIKIPVRTPALGFHRVL